MMQAAAPRLALRYAVLFPLLAGGLLWLSSDVAWVRPAREVWLQATAAATGWVGEVVGLVGRRDGLTLFHPGGQAIRIVQGCDAVPTLALFVAAVLVAPVAPRPKATFALLGLVALTALNVARLLHLLHLRGAGATSFQSAHEMWWPLVLFAAAGLLYLAWAARITGVERA